MFSHGTKLGAGEPGNVGILLEIVRVRSIIFITKDPQSLKYHFTNFQLLAISYVLINSDLGTDESIIEKIKEILEGEKEIEYEIRGVYGVYDIILKLNSDNIDNLRSTITNRIRKITSVQSTLTMMVIEEQEKS